MRKLLVLIIISTFIIAPSQSMAADTVIYGRGYGHGVGMSMAGVYGMAQAGNNYQQITNNYYPNAVWSTRNDDTVIQARCAKHGVWVNISVKEYLYRLAEEPNAWPKEGLKALMMASRSYLWYKIESKGKFESGQYWIHDINPAIRPNIVAAVNETTNQVLTYNNRAIVAAYSASAGGWTAKMSEVWGGSDTPYPYLTNIDSSADSVFSSSYQWQVNLSAGAIQAVYPTIGQFSGLTITERTSADLATSRVKKIAVAGTSGTVTDTGWNFKSKLKLKSNYFWLNPWPQRSSPAPKKILQTSARKAVIRKNRRSKLWYRIVDSDNKNVQVYLIFKKGKKRVGRKYSGIKATNKLAHTGIRFKNLSPGTYRFYVVAIDSVNNRTQNPGSNLLIIRK